MKFLYSSKDLRGQTLSTVTYEISDDSNIHEVMQEFRKFLLAVGFQPQTIDKYVEAE